MIHEYTADEIFYNDETYTPEHAMIYITYLERKIKAKNEAIEFLIFETSDHLTHQIKSLTKIRKI